ncbi:MAG: hypothetical protein RLZZ529_1648 [Bacteroidota bacterium]|jgi:hypothetical protein
MSDYLISIFQYLENENATSYNSRILFLLQSLTDYPAIMLDC